MEYVVMSVLRFLATDPDGTVGIACLDSGMGGNGCGVLDPFPPGFRREVDDIAFFMKSFTVGALISLLC